MLTLEVSAKDFWDEQNEKFVKSYPATLHLEHTLVSVSKWEAKFKKSFFLKEEKTREETIEYIMFMCMDDNVDKLAIAGMNSFELAQINNYINDPMTATTFAKDTSGKVSKEMLTSELIYYWMVAYRIPADYQHWHLNRLLTLIHVCSVKQEKPKKMKNKDIRSRNAALNAKRRAALHSNG